MRFSDLNSRAKKGEVPAGSPVRNAPPECAKKTEEPVKPLDAAIPDFPSGPLSAAAPERPAVPEAHPAPRTGSEADTAPAEPPISRKNRQRKHEAADRAVERPFKELDAQAREIYSRNISLAKELITQADLGYLKNYDSLMRLAELNSGTLSENQSLLSYTRYATPDDYLYAHSANVAVISQAMGLELKLDKSVVNFLGFCALAHDLGMTDYAELARKEGPLTDAEYAEITRHSASGAAKLDRFMDMEPGLRDRAKKVIVQVHERIDAGGYPDRLTNEEIDPLAQIIGIADVYEAMSHPRSWRPAGHPHNVIKHIIDKEGKGFNSKIVKAALEVLSLYPPGSMVALSTGETASVVKVNAGSLTRPTVAVWLDPDGAQVPVRLVDLIEHPLTSIERIVEEKELTTRNPKFAARRELSRWWVDW
ncbi:MAG: HD domain-containing phosphohydrolase [Elusimicrobiales bacterium]|jgi:HD-GYP domain-containing protein (c-di-GMP phosphodiesterase class II)